MSAFLHDLWIILQRQDGWVLVVIALGILGGGIALAIDWPQSPQVHTPEDLPSEWRLSREEIRKKELAALAVGRDARRHLQ